MNSTNVQQTTNKSSSYHFFEKSVVKVLTMRLFLLLTEQSKEGGLGDANNLETDTGDITDGMTRTTETSNEDFIVFINVVQTTIARNEGGDLLTVLDKLNTDALTNSRVRLLSFNTTTHYNNKLE